MEADWANRTRRVEQPSREQTQNPFGIVPRIDSTVNDGVSALFVALKAANAATLLADGTECVMPRMLVARPFSAGAPTQIPWSEGLLWQRIYTDIFVYTP